MQIANLISCIAWKPFGTFSKQQAHNLLLYVTYVNFMFLKVTSPIIVFDCNGSLLTFCAHYSWNSSTP